MLRFALRVVQQRNEIMHTSSLPVKHFSEKSFKKPRMKVHPNVKILQSQGLGNRKFCEKILWSSEIFLNSAPFNPDNDLIQWGDTLSIDGNSYQISQFKYVLMNKPAGYETSHKPSRHRSVFELLPPHYLERGIQAAGRLDVDTTGLLLFSDDGQFIHRIISGKQGIKKEVEKVYVMALDTPLLDGQIDQLLNGVELQEEHDTEWVKASRAERLDDGRLRMGITTGKYHQVKRMLVAVGNHVTTLHRESVGPYRLPDDLAPGQWIEFDPTA
ncbi:MAG TPA: 16S rRNA pseudouridine(516) synthase [Limnobacter sp.]|uniref:16S rRNA pseudouridine(516) synthase n=1 Tax=Limnobacter sp. TaxID=2003368 RepID=UPI002ED7E3FC